MPARSAVPLPPPRFHPNLAQLCRRKVADLRTLLADPDVRPEAVEILHDADDGERPPTADHGNLDFWRDRIYILEEGFGGRRDASRSWIVYGRKREARIWKNDEF
jgi:hypothetical protein